MGFFNNFNHKNLFESPPKDKKHDQKRRRYNTIIAPMNNKKRGS